jgi:hypothetical protein
MVAWGPNPAPQPTYPFVEIDFSCCQTTTHFSILFLSRKTLFLIPPLPSHFGPTFHLSDSSRPLQLRPCLLFEIPRYPIISLRAPEGSPTGSLGGLPPGDQEAA